MKKWLSYREHALLGRDLTPAEAREVTAMARRLAALRQDPGEQEADRQQARTGDQLDEILALLRSLPRKDATDGEDSKARVTGWSNSGCARC